MPKRKAEDFEPSQSLLDDFLRPKPCKISHISAFTSPKPSSNLPQVKAVDAKRIINLHAEDERPGSTFLLGKPAARFKNNGHKVINLAISVERFSSYDSDETRKALSRLSSQNRTRHFLERFHDHESCKCRPRTHHILFNGIKSNHDIANTNDTGPIELAALLKSIDGAMAGTIVLLIPAADGITTNSCSFHSFFHPFEHLDLQLVICNESMPSLELQAYNVNEIIAVIESVKLGARLQSLESEAARLVETMVKASLNESLMSLGHVSNLTLGIGNGRNTFRAPPSPAPPVASSLQQLVDGMRLGHKQTVKQNKGARSVKEYVAILDEVTGRISCPCLDCNLQFPDLASMIVHLVIKSYTIHHKCVICGQTFSSSKKQPYDVHINRHFPDRYPCDGDCGNECCSWVGSCAKDVNYHKAMMNPTHECSVCHQKYGLASLLTKHIESVHVRQHQVIGFAVESGFEVGMLGSVAPWMKGPIDAKDEVPVHIRLALQAAKAVIDARKHK